MWDLPGAGIEPMSLMLAARFLTTGPPGKSKYSLFFKQVFKNVKTSSGWSSWQVNQFWWTFFPSGLCKRRERAQHHYRCEYRVLALWDILESGFHPSLRYILVHGASSSRRLMIRAQTTPLNHRRQFPPTCGLVAVEMGCVCRLGSGQF